VEGDYSHNSRPSATKIDHKGVILPHSIGTGDRRKNPRSVHVMCERRKKRRGERSDSALPLACLSRSM